MNWNDINVDELDGVIAWAESQPWARAMYECQQDATWHAEGDVWTHTKLVVRQLANVDGWEKLNQRERKIVIFAALLHDVAKPQTSAVDPDTGKIRSPKHAVKGEPLARKLLREMKCDLVDRERVAKLVRYHGRPVFLTERQSPMHEVILTSWLLNNRLLYFLALADARGRDHSTSDRPEENLHYWKLLSEEAGCFSQPYPFSTENARFTFFRQPNPNRHYVPHDSFRCHVTMMSGLPGVGKDTWLKKHRPDLPLVSLDQIRRDRKIDPKDDQGQVIQAAKEACREFLRAEQDFCFNATNLLRSTRARWIDLFADYDAFVELVYLEPALDVIRRQNRQRATAAGTDVELVPENVIHRLAERMDVPSELECHRLISEPEGLAMAD